VDKVLSAIDSARICDMDKYIAALGIPLIGSTASKELIKVFSSWNDFIIAAEGNYHFYDIPNFGAEMNSAIHNFNYNEAKFIADNYINFAFENDMSENKNETILADKTFVITGKLKHFKNRDEIKSKIESLGGKVTGSVSKKTDYLINNDKNSTSSKNETAKSLNIPILSEEDFITTFGIID
jgi:DNA ligase (NAD+)